MNLKKLMDINRIKIKRSQNILSSRDRREHPRIVKSDTAIGLDYTRCGRMAGKWIKKYASDLLQKLIQSQST